MLALASTYWSSPTRFGTRPAGTRATSAARRVGLAARAWLDLVPGTRFGRGDHEKLPKRWDGRCFTKYRGPKITHFIGGSTSWNCMVIWMNFLYNTVDGKGRNPANSPVEVGT